jgi:hypothetical protein
MRTITLPYGLLVIASVFGWCLSMGNKMPLHWRWCVVIIAAYALIALVVSGGILADPEMLYLRRIPMRWPWAFLAASIAVIVFIAAHFAGLNWLRIALFEVAFFVMVFWTAAAAMGGARLFLRVDHGLSSSYPLD